MKPPPVSNVTPFGMPMPTKDIPSDEVKVVSSSAGDLNFTTVGPEKGACEAPDALGPDERRDALAVVRVKRHKAFARERAPDGGEAEQAERGTVAHGSVEDGGGWRLVGGVDGLARFFVRCVSLCARR